MKRMTVVFEDDALYTAVKVEAARRNRRLKDLVTDALREWLEEQEDAEWLPAVEAARADWRARGGVEARKLFGRIAEEENLGRPPG